MKSFPMFIKTTDRRVVIVGGGEQAAQKARLILKTDAKILLVWPELEPELAELVAEGRAEHFADYKIAGVFEDAAMAFIATGCPGVDSAICGLARAVNCPVNVVDRPDLCTIITPSIVDRDPVVIAIGTEGTAPVLARQIKTKLEQQLPVTLGGLASLVGRLRPMVAANVARSKRRAFWEWVFNAAPLSLWSQGSEREAARQIKEAIAMGGAPTDTGHGQLSIVAMRDAQSDLLPLRAVNRLQQADTVYFSPDIDQGALELARRDAERVRILAGGIGDVSGVIDRDVRAGAKVVVLIGDDAQFANVPSEVEVMHVGQPDRRSLTRQTA